MDPAVLLDMLTVQLSSILYSSAISSFSHMTQQNHIHVSPWYQSSHNPNLLNLISSLTSWSRKPSVNNSRDQQTTELQCEHLICAACTWTPSIAHMLKRTIEQGFANYSWTMHMILPIHKFGEPLQAFSQETIKLIILVTCLPIIRSCAWGRPSRYKEMECWAHEQARFRWTFSTIDQWIVTLGCQIDHCCFVDFCKVFHPVSKEHLFQRLGWLYHIWG